MGLLFFVVAFFCFSTSSSRLFHSFLSSSLSTLSFVRVCFLACEPFVDQSFIISYMYYTIIWPTRLCSKHSELDFNLTKYGLLKQDNRKLSNMIWHMLFLYRATEKFRGRQFFLLLLRVSTWHHFCNDTSVLIFPFTL